MSKASEQPKMSAPTLINLPPPPSDPVTPSEMGPGTPNSGTTSMSELSTVAIKDGHRGHPRGSIHKSHPSGSLDPTDANASTQSKLDAERADRISRLAGLERVAQPPMRPSSNASSLPPGASASHPQGYFDSPTAGTVVGGTPISGGANVGTMATKERSTVGSASATGSIGGRTTWASESDVYDPTDKDTSEEMETSSVGAASNEDNASLVGFGEGASSTVSGPISSIPPPGARTPQRQLPRGDSTRSPLSSTPMSGLTGPGGAVTPQPANYDARMIDGMTYDQGVVDTTRGNPAASGHGLDRMDTGGTEAAERIMRHSSIVDEDVAMTEGGSMSEVNRSDGQRKLGSFSFEDGQR